MELSTCGLIPGEQPQRVPEDAKISVHDVGNDSCVWKFVESRLQQSLPQAELLSVNRIWNPRLWKLFQAQKEMLERDNGGNANGKLLFHGAAPERLQRICGLSLDAEPGSGNSGFYTNVGGDGQYSASGCGSYFAEHAAYPVSIHPRHRTHGHQYLLIVAEVLCGKIKDFGKLCQPGLRSAHEIACGGHYDSVSGTEDGIGNRIPYSVSGIENEEFGRQFITFHNDRAYPHFVIALRRGFRITNIASGRSLYASKQGNWTERVGAGLNGDSAVGADGDWMIMRIERGIFRIVNIESGRCLYANKTENWERGFGAGYPKEHVGEDGCWKLLADGDYWRIVNSFSGRCLYASIGTNWEEKRGAGHPSEKVGEDGRWKLSRSVPSTWFD